MPPLSVPTPIPLFASVSDAADLLGIPRSNLYRALAAGRFRAVKHGRRTLLDVRHAVGVLRASPAFDGRAGA
jgi:excisionase family DNA binding protein